MYGPWLSLKARDVERLHERPLPAESSLLAAENVGLS